MSLIYCFPHNVRSRGKRDEYCPKCGTKMIPHEASNRCRKCGKLCIISDYCRKCGTRFYYYTEVSAEREKQLLKEREEHRQRMRQTIRGIVILLSLITAAILEFLVVRNMDRVSEVITRWFLRF